MKINNLTELKTPDHNILFLAAGKENTFTARGRTGRTGEIQSYRVSRAGRYRIVAGGARGGKHVTNYGAYPGKKVHNQPM